PLVGHHGGDVVRARQLQRLLAARGVEQLERLAEVEAEGVEVVLLVVHDQHRKLRQFDHRRGHLMKTVAFLGGPRKCCYDRAFPMMITRTTPDSSDAEAA